MYALAISVHVLAAVVWVGGMFFAHMALRPAAMELPPPQRLTLWKNTLSRFFNWVWISIALLWVSGLYIIMTLYGGMAGTPVHAHLMLGIALIMTLLYAAMFFLPYQKMKALVSAEDFPNAAKQQAQIRLVVIINLILGLINMVVGSSGAYMG